MINLHKLDWMALLSLHNALRLHADSICLYKERRYPSAFQLSVLAQEEIGKAHMVSHFVWHSRINGRCPDELETKFLESLYKHPLKQGAFLSNSSGSMFLLGTKKGRALYQGVFNGDLEFKKQTATYVGLRRKGKTIDVKGRIMSPYYITREKSHSQISTVHDYLVDSCVGIISDQYEFDISDIRRVMNRRTYKQLMNNWPVQSKEVKKWIKKIESFLEKEGMKPLK